MLSEIMTKTIQMANYKKTIDMANLADVVIAPDISSVKPSDHPKVKEIAELGYKEAKIQIEKWLAKKKAEEKNSFLIIFFFLEPGDPLFYSEICSIYCVINTDICVTNVLNNHASTASALPDFFSAASFSASVGST